MDKNADFSSSVHSTTGAFTRFYRFCFKINPEKIYLYVSSRQKRETVVGSRMWDELRGKRTLGVDTLEYLLENSELIPEKWKDKYVFFWGTIYRNSAGGLFVRYLHWNGSNWDWGCRLLVRDFSSDDPAALLK